jgi:hypothetical protein
MRLAARELRRCVLTITRYEPYCGCEVKDKGVKIW